MSTLQEALILVENSEVQKYMTLSGSYASHHFSRKYMKRRERMIRKHPRIVREARRKRDAYEAASGNFYETLRGTSIETSYGIRSYRRRCRILLAAVLITLLAVISVIAIARPHIYYVIKEKIDRWHITFQRDEANSGNAEIEAVVPRRPEIPEGFNITVEEPTDTNYFVVLEDGAGHSIVY